MFAGEPVHPDVRLRQLDTADGWIATDRGLIWRLGTKQVRDPANQSGLQHVPLFRESRFLQPLRVSLVPAEALAQKQSLGRPRHLFGSHHIEAQAPKVRPVPDDSQPELASHGPPCRLHGGHSVRITRLATVPFRARLVQFKGQVDMRIISFSEARNNLKQVIDQVVDDADVAVISRRDSPDAVVMSLETFNSWMETVHLLKTPANAAHLDKSIQQLRKGKTRMRALVEA